MSCVTSLKFNRLSLRVKKRGISWRAMFTRLDNQATLQENDRYRVAVRKEHVKGANKIE